jgi:hypothetical protein
MNRSKYLHFRGSVQFLKIYFYGKGNQELETVYIGITSYFTTIFSVILSGAKNLNFL